jgi:hypothetical protein
MGYKFNPFTGALDAVDSPIGSSGQVIYNNSGALAGISTLTFDGTSVTLAGRLINSYTSLASAPASVFTGTWFTGGTSTTTKPHFLIEPTGATSTAWSTSGTGLGVNAASGFAGKLLDLQLNGTSRMVVQGDGKVGIGTTAPISIFDVALISGGVRRFVVNYDDSIITIKGSNESSNPEALRLVADSVRFSTGTSGSGAERARIDNSGRLLIGTSSDSGGALLQVNGNRVRVATAKTPASASDTGTAGEICWDSSYIYVCTATDTWKRAALSTW